MPAQFSALVEITKLNGDFKKSLRCAHWSLSVSSLDQRYARPLLVLGRRDFDGFVDRARLVGEARLRLVARRLSARWTPMRANIVGPFRSATRMRASIAACHSGASCSALGSLVMYSAASRRVASGLLFGGRTGSSNFLAQPTPFHPIGDVFAKVD